MPQAGSWEPQDGSQLRSPARIAFCCEVISQPFLSVCEISQTPFSLAKWSLEHPDICYRHWEIFYIIFLLSKSQNTPCKPPITRFLSFKLVKRENIHVIISFILCSYKYLSGACSRERSFCEVLGKQVKFSSLYCLTFSLCIFIFLLSYALSEEFSPENE